MRYHDMPSATPRPNDLPAVVRDIAALAAAGVDVRRPAKNPYQLKVSPTVSYYPSSGKILKDGDREALATRGVEGLLAFLSTSTQPGPANDLM